MTFSFAALDVLPPTGVVFEAVHLSKTVMWPRDGVSWQAAHGTTGVHGYAENPNGAPNFTVTVNETTNQILDPGGGADNRNPHGGILTPNAVLDVGAEVSPAVSRFSQYGIEWGVTSARLNRTTRGDGAVFRVRDANSVGGSAVVLMAFGAMPGAPVRVPGIQGAICLDLSGLPPITVGAGALDATGTLVDGSLFGYGVGGFPATGTFHFQGAIIAAAGVSLTNAVEIVVD